MVQSCGKPGAGLGRGCGAGSQGARGWRAAGAEGSRGREHSWVGGGCGQGPASSLPQTGQAGQNDTKLSAPGFGSFPCCIPLLASGVAPVRDKIQLLITESSRSLEQDGFPFHESVQGSCGSSKHQQSHHAAKQGLLSRPAAAHRHSCAPKSRRGGEGAEGANTQLSEATPRECCFHFPPIPGCRTATNTCLQESWRM